MTEHAAIPMVEAWHAIQAAHSAHHRCWPCLLGQHVGGEHEWISEPEDEDWLQETNVKLAVLGLPPIPREDMKCSCACTIDLSMAPDMPDNGPPDMDQESLTSTPCPECGEVGACAYDDLGRALIHATGDSDRD